MVCARRPRPAHADAGQPGRERAQALPAWHRDRAVGDRRRRPRPHSRPRQRPGHPRRGARKGVPPALPARCQPHDAGQRPGPEPCQGGGRPARRHNNARGPQPGSRRHRQLSGCASPGSLRRDPDPNVVILGRSKERSDARRP
ncbi:hypothetical protein MPL1032_80242 [Mesorhizobium plurifarium]|uniref:Uncharacterized protein n=1 Tax=Mesorhizobium plurifarium TaxID=69974 RepID=A0A0K2W7D0_MESPL|nr:hypothetical protein MPL1032_80242 [Mesorhizobium plurifarium]